MSKTTQNRRKKKNRRLLRLWNTKKWPSGFVWWSHSICDIPVIGDQAFLDSVDELRNFLFHKHTELGNEQS